MYIHQIIKKKIKRRISKQVYKLWDATAYDQLHMVGKWYKAGGDEKYRYDYPLKQTSVVFDVGGYEGEWVKRIFNKYKCHVYVFEPVKSYAEKIRKAVPDKKVRVFDFGLSGKTRSEKINVDKFTSSTFKSGDRAQTIKLFDVIEFCQQHNIKKIDLIKINIEGGEYELLERILDSKFVNNIDRFQIQFHDFVPMGELRMEKIQRRLSKTHKPTYQFWFVWENWIKKGLKN